MPIRVMKVLILLRDGTDLVDLHTDLPSPLPKVSQEPLVVTFNTERDCGLAYVEEHLRLHGSQIEIINTRKDRP